VPRTWSTYEARARMLKLAAPTVAMESATNRGEAGRIVAVPPSGDLCCSYPVYEGVFPDALLRGVRVVVCDEKDIDAYSTQLGKTVVERNQGIDAEHELKSLQVLHSNVMDLLENLKAKEGEKEALLDIVSDWTTGQDAAAEALAASAQAAIKWTRQSSSTGSSTAADAKEAKEDAGADPSGSGDEEEDDEDVPSIVMGAGGGSGSGGGAKKKKAKGKGKRKATSGGTGGASSSEAAEEGSTTAASIPTEFQLSAGARDAHVYRGQCAHWLRMTERRILESLLQKLELAISELKELVIHFAQNPNATDEEVLAKLESYTNAGSAGSSEGASAPAPAPAPAAEMR
jgi:hypothetical protein